MTRRFAICIALLATATVGADPERSAVSFVGCPIARDTGPDTDVCFLVEHDGERYALAGPPDWGDPQLGHRVLVEGRPTGGALVCGARPIEGRVSVLREIDSACNELLPDDGSVQGTAGGVFRRGTPAQKAYAEELAHRAAADPRWSIEPAILDPEPTPMPEPPFLPRALTVLHPYASDRATGPDMLKVRDLAIYARVAGAHRVEIRSQYAASRLNTGQILPEVQEIARARAAKIAAVFSAMGVDPAVIVVKIDSAMQAGTGDGDWSRRSTTVTVTP